MVRIIDLITDAFENTLSGLGTIADKMRSTTWVTGQTVRSTDDQYEEIYNESWLARRIVQTLPDQALRKRPKIKDVEDEAALWARFDALNVTDQYPQGVLLQGLYQGRLHGGAVIIPGFVRGEPTEPVPEPGVATELAWLDVVRWADLRILARETDANRPEYDQPVLFEVQGDHARRGYRFHATRAIFCEGAPRARCRRSDITPWLSVLDPVFEEIKRYDTAWQSIGLMLSEASVGVLKLQGLVRMLAEKDQSVVESRMQLMSQGRSMARTVFLDADGQEDYSRTEVSFVSVPQLLEQQELQISGASEIPIALLLGQAPAGLNATGENDRAQFDDRTAVYQRTSVKPKVAQLLSWILGKPVDIEFPPIREMTEAEVAEIRQKNAEVDRTYWEMGVLDPIEVAVARARDGSLGIEIDVDAKEQAWLASQSELPEGASIDVNPTAVAATITVNELRASNKLEPLPGPEGEMKVAELLAAFGAGRPGGVPPKESPPVTDSMRAGLTGVLDLLVFDADDVGAWVAHTRDGITLCRCESPNWLARFVEG